MNPTTCLKEMIQAIQRWAKVGMDSKFLLCVIASLIAVSYFTVDTEPVDLAFAAESEITYDVFDNPPKFFGDNMIIASPGKNTDGILGAGSISVIDPNTNSLLYTINNPNPTEHDLFGEIIATSDSYIMVGVQELSSIYGNYVSAEIYVFDGKTGELLHTIKNPNEDKWDMKFSAAFGRSIGSIGDNIVAGSYFQKSDYSTTHLMHVFDGKTGLLLYTINDPHTNTDSDFGRRFTIVNDNIVVGVPVWGSDNRFSGVIHVFNGKTGSLLSTINDPGETERDFDRNFGESVVPAGDNIAVRSSGMVYIFEGSTGELLQTIDHPNLSNVELDMIVDSIDDANTIGYFFIVLAVGVVSGGIALGIVVFMKKKQPKQMQA